MRMLVTGANGFVGHRLCTYLAEDGHQVLRTVRVHDGLPDTIELDESASTKDLTSVLTDVDCIIHLAAAVHVMGKVDSRLEGIYQETNVEFTRRLAQAAHDAGVRRFVFVSSIKVCGERSCGRPLREADAGHPTDPYALSKWVAEQELRRIEGQSGLEVVIVRPPLIYGPGVRANFLALLSVVSAGLPLPFSWLRNKRSLIYLENFVSALAACATHPRAAGETFHVSDSGSVTLPELVTEISKATGRRPRIFPFPRWLLRFAGGVIGKFQQIDRLVSDLEVDSGRIHGLLGWSPPYAFAEGIQATVDWYRHGRHPRHTDRTDRPASAMARLAVCQLCAVDFTLRHLLLPLVDGMREQGWSVTSVCSDGRYTQDMRRRGYKLHTVSISRNLFNVRAHLRAIWSIYKLCRDGHFDVLHVHTPIAALLGRIAGRMAGVPMIVYTAHGFYFHDEMPWWKYRFFVLLERWSGWLTDYLFTQSSEDAQTAVVERIVSASKVTAIGNGVSVDLFTPDPDIRARTRTALGLPADAYVIGVIARLVREKGLVEFLEAATTLGAHFPRAHFLLVGERLSSDHNASVERELREAQETLGSRLIAPGYRADVAELLGAMDLFCLPSHREGMPRSIIEAMMMELPVVATDIRGAREEVIPGETGLLVPTRNAAALTQALETLVSDPERGQCMGRFGRQRALALYDERRVVARQIEIIGTLCAPQTVHVRRGRWRHAKVID
jgi:nucleoside-diphosphate-sugar epimerase